MEKQSKDKKPKINSKKYGVHKVKKVRENSKKSNVNNKKKKLKPKNKLNISDMKKILIKNKNKVLILLLVIVALIILLFTLYKIIYKYRNNKIFALNAEKIQQDIENPIFRIEKILIYSDANIEDLSEKQNLSDINISQYTDFAIYINNTETIKELTEENTVNQIYIDNITVTQTDFGTQKVYYKNINDICKYRKISSGSNKIDFKVLHTNEEKSEINESNVFYTDCSEPIILSYVNEDFIKNEDLSTSNEILSLDGSILNYLGIELDDLDYTISFTINIENNLGELYKCNCLLDINLDSDEGGIYTGYIMQIYDLTEDNFTFRKVQ